MDVLILGPCVELSPIELNGIDNNTEAITKYHSRFGSKNPTRA